jgi:ATP-dependent Lon protease
MKKWQKEYLHNMKLRATNKNLNAYKKNTSYQLAELDQAINELFIEIKKAWKPIENTLKKIIGKLK